MPSSRLRAPWARLVPEFVVIVVGVLAALAVDQWAQSRRDRTLETEYLERLLEDVRYDLEELAFIRERSAVSAEFGRLALEDDWVRRAPADSLVGVALSALQSRVPDLSRSTFNELVSSGRIDLLRSRAVREGLADYDRIVAEFVGFYGIAGSEGVVWIWSRLPPDQRQEYEVACRGDTRAGSRIVLTTCPFDWDFDVEGLRRDLLEPAARGLLRLNTNRNFSAVRVTDGLIEAAEALEEVLLGAQPSG